MTGVRGARRAAARALVAASDRVLDLARAALPGRGADDEPEIAEDVGAVPPDVSEQAPCACDLCAARDALARIEAASPMGSTAAFSVPRPTGGQWVVLPVPTITDWRADGTPLAVAAHLRETASAATLAAEALAEAAPVAGSA